MLHGHLLTVAKPLDDRLERESGREIRFATGTQILERLWICGEPRPIDDLCQRRSKVRVHSAVIWSTDNVDNAVRCQFELTRQLLTQSREQWDRSLQIDQNSDKIFDDKTAPLYCSR